MLVSPTLFLIPSSSSAYLAIHVPWWTNSSTNSTVSLPIFIPLPPYVPHLYCTVVFVLRVFTFKSHPNSLAVFQRLLQVVTFCSVGSVNNGTMSFNKGGKKTNLSSGIHADTCGKTRRTDGCTGMTKLIGALRDLRQLTYIVLRLIFFSPVYRFR